MTSLATERDWMASARCTDPQEMSVPIEASRHARREAVARGKAICASCPVLAECRHWALTDANPLVGIVVGGMSPGELTRERNRPEYRSVWIAKRQKARCGTLAGYALHCRSGTTPCDACRDAYRRFSCPSGTSW